MERGLRLALFDRLVERCTCPNTRPDEEGIETLCRVEIPTEGVCPNTRPDEEGGKDKV